MSAKVSKWIEKTREIFTSEKKISYPDAEILLETGEKLKVNTEELKKLRAELKAARNWSDEVDKLSSENGSLHVNDVKRLIAHHERLLIEMPEEVEELKQAIVGYCICRGPSHPDGFMIGCDHCEVSIWFLRLFQISLNSPSRYPANTSPLFSFLEGVVPRALCWYI